MALARNGRISKELATLKRSPPPGAQCWQVLDDLVFFLQTEYFANLKVEDKTDTLEAVLLGPPDTPYSGGVFKLEILLPERYPFEPPKLRFVTQIYHPNVDEGGRICLDILKVRCVFIDKSMHREILFGSLSD